MNIILLLCWLNIVWPMWLIYFYIKYKKEMKSKERWMNEFYKQMKGEMNDFNIM